MGKYTKMWRNKVFELLNQRNGEWTQAELLSALNEIGITCSQANIQRYLKYLGYIKQAWCETNSIIII